MSKSVNYIDLFSGCGGLSLGMEQAGFTLNFASDIDPVCCNTFLKNRPYFSKDRMFTGDIADLNCNYQDYAAYFKDADFICGGPPCQGFSMANRQRLIDDPRNILYKEYLKFLEKTKPSFFIMENVRGMLQKMPEILEDMRHIIGNDYLIDYTVLNARDYGVPQNRYRLIAIGNNLGVDSSSVIEKLLLSTHSTPKFNLGEAISDLPALQPNRVKNNSALENDSVGYFEREFDCGCTDFRNFINCGRSIKKVYNHKNRFNNDRDIEIYSRLPQGGNSLDPSIADIMPYSRRNGIFKDKYYRLKNDDVCKTITAHMRYDCNMYIHPTQPRGLSPREAARIQTFPDDFVFYGPRNSWYKQIGNAVPVKLAEAIGKEIIRWL